MDMFSPNPLAYKAKSGNTIKSEKYKIDIIGHFSL